METEITIYLDNWDNNIQIENLLMQLLLVILFPNLWFSLISHFNYDHYG